MKNPVLYISNKDIKLVNSKAGNFFAGNKIQSKEKTNKNLVTFDDVVRQLNALKTESKTNKKLSESNEKVEQTNDEEQEGVVTDKSRETSEDEQINEASQAVASQKSKKKKILSLIFFIVNIGVVAGILISQIMGGDVASLKDVFVYQIKWGYFFLAFVVWLVLVNGADMVKSNCLIKSSTGKNRFTLAYKMNSQGRYYDCITPMATGGQPFQVYYLLNRGLNSSSALSVPIARYVIDQMSWTLISFVAILLSIIKFGSYNLVSFASYIGFGINFCLIVIVLLVSTNEKIGKGLVAKGLKLLYKMKIIKNYEKKYESVMTTVNNFQKTMKKFAGNMKMFLFVMFLGVLQNIALYSIPALIYLMFGGVLTFEIYLQLIVFSILISLASGFIPLPGGTGVNEISFTSIFRPIFPTGTIFWAMLFNRIFNYYAYILQGIILIIYDYCIGNKKYQWQKRKWELEEESLKFKAEQLKNYKKRNKNNIMLK